MSAIKGEIDEPQARPHQRRNLIAQALAAACRQHGQRATPVQDLADHSRLEAAKIGMAERMAQDVAGGIERGSTLDFSKGGR